ncbi:hypothetical protein [Paenibacillus illinoisensis]|uniref:hypothetical protein n=1 Tax=Paenibacillus illinoisensis TaxID=59845 RepID=UPI001C8EAD9B|nr:hypothetical protein [Paenibacillus illinoisensis]MBY0220368.1 hypothetical protein [Paenibacillus illinoisensis]
MAQKKKLQIVVFLSVLYLIALVCMYAYEYHFKSVWFEEKLQAVEMSKLDKSISFSVDSLSATDDGSMQLSGWAFMNGLSATKQKIVILAQSDDETQYLFTTTTTRKDVTQSFDNKINYDDSGFVTKFKPSKLKDNIYKIGIYLENGDKKAFIDTGSIMYKDDGEVVMEYLSRTTNLSLDLEKRKMKYSIDAVEEKKFGIEMVGWSFAEDINMKDSSIYILLNNDNEQKLIFNTIKMIRDDVKQNYESENLDYSGFVVRIPYDELKDETDYKVSIIIRNNNKDSVIKTDRIIQKMK